MQITKNVLYIGTDEAYWQSLIARFEQTYAEHIEINYIDLPPCTLDSVNSQLLDVLNIQADFIYLDLSSSSDSLYQLGQYIKRTRIFNKIALVGLVDKVAKIEETILLGFDFVFIKGAELHDVVYHPFFKSFPKQALKKDFALAKSKIDSTLIETFRIGYYSTDYMHIECNRSFSPGDIVKIDTAIETDKVKSNKFIVKEKNERDLYYSYDYSYDLTYKILDDYVVDENDMSEAHKITDDKLRKKKIQTILDARKQRAAEHDDKKVRMQKEIKKWISTNQEKKTAKKTKVLIVDERLTFLETENRRLDSFPCTIRIETSFDGQFQQIDNYLPNLIVFKIPDYEIPEEMVNPTPEELKSLKAKHEGSYTEFFSTLVSKVVSITDYSPFIIIFNCANYTSKSFQESFKYDLILTNSSPVDFNLIMKMANLFETKHDEKFKKILAKKIQDLKKQDPKKYGKLTEADFDEFRYYVSKKSPLSKASYEQKILIKAISESEIYFYSDQVIKLSNYKLANPFPMFVSLVMQEDKEYQTEDGKFLYKGLIHSIGEIEKKELRMLVNDIYTAHKKEERKKEEEAFKELNKQKIEAQKLREAELALAAQRMEERKKDK